MDKISTTKNSADEPKIGNSKQPLMRTMAEDIETLKHDSSQTRPAPKNLPPKDLPVASPAPPAPVKKPQAFGEPPFVPFSGKQKPEAAPQKSGAPVLQKTVSVRPEDNLPPIARLARQGPVSSANLMPRAESSRVFSRPNAPISAGIAPKTNPPAPTEKPKQNFTRILKNIFIAILLGVFIFGVYRYVGPIFIKPSNVLPPLEIPPSLVADAKNVSVSAELDSGLMLSVRKYLEDNKNRADVYGASRLIIKNTAGTETLKTEDLKDFLGINLPAGFLEAVDKNYSLLSFNYPENNYLRLGIVFKINKPEIISQEASSWEPAMFGDLSPLFLGAPAFYDLAKNFASNVYLGASVRYLPLGKPGTALNYAIDENKKFFMLATSKEDIYYLIEKTAENQ